MHNPEYNEKKLMPLRKFAVDNIYSPAYLSQLVQRGKLKARKIGRNYYTCAHWFGEYLDQHAQDVKFEKYQEYLEEKTRKSEPELKPVKINNIWKQIAVSAAVFLLFIIIGMSLYISYNKGRIAGVEESGSVSSVEDMVE